MKRSIFNVSRGDQDAIRKAFCIKTPKFFSKHFIYQHLIRTTQNLFFSSFYRTLHRVNWLQKLMTYTSFSLRLTYFSNIYMLVVVQHTIPYIFTIKFMGHLHIVFFLMSWPLFLLYLNLTLSLIRVTKCFYELASSFINLLNI